MTTTSSPKLPDLSSEYPLTLRQIESYRRDGHIYLPQVCTLEEVAAYRQAITEAAYANFPDLRALDQRDAFGKAFLQTLNLSSHRALDALD